MSVQDNGIELVGFDTVVPTKGPSSQVWPTTGWDLGGSPRRKKIRILEFEAWTNERGEWEMPLLEGMENNPFSAKTIRFNKDRVEDALNVLREDIKQRKDHRIAYVKMTNRMAAMFVIAGIISPFDLLSAPKCIDELGDPYYELAKIFLEGRPFKVVIYSEKSPIREHREHHFATVDEWGTPV